LASVGVFAEDDRHRFALISLGNCLTSDVPESQGSLAIMQGEAHFQAFGSLYPRQLQKLVSVLLDALMPWLVYSELAFFSRSSQNLSALR
jgi:hypothetical protein